jgi:hypothetical protein
MTYNFIIPNDYTCATLQLTEVDGFTQFSLQANFADNAFISKLGISLITDDYDCLEVTDVSASGKFQQPSFTVGEDSFKGGGENYDIGLTFSTSNRNGGQLRFNAQDSLTFVVNAPISAFRYDKQIGITAHIQNIGKQSNSMWACPTIPEPSSTLIACLLFISILTKRNR